jgi:hypothetical protein
MRDGDREKWRGWDALRKSQSFEPCESLANPAPPGESGRSHNQSATSSNRRPQHQPSLALSITCTALLVRRVSGPHLIPVKSCVCRYSPRDCTTRTARPMRQILHNRRDTTARICAMAVLQDCALYHFAAGSGCAIGTVPFMTERRRTHRCEVPKPPPALLSIS